MAYKSHFLTGLDLLPFTMQIIIFSPYNNNAQKARKLDFILHFGK